MGKLKQNPTEHSDDIRKRVLFAMGRVMTSNKDVRTRSKFAARIGTTPQAINKWENLIGLPTLENIAEICLQFSISADWLITGTGKMFGDAELTFRIEELESRMTAAERKIGIRQKG